MQGMDDASILLTQANHLGIFGPLAKPHLTSLNVYIIPDFLDFFIVSFLF